MLSASQLVCSRGERVLFENLRHGNRLDGHPLTEPQGLEALTRMGLRGRCTLPTRFLSAGQKRRVLLARLLA